MLAVGIDISKSKSVAAILNQDGSMHTSPFEFHHTQPELDAFIKYILNSNQSATILMENTGHYHYPVLKAFREAGLPVCMVNAYQIKKFGDMDLRKAKTDKKDADCQICIRKELVSGSIHIYGAEIRRFKIFGTTV